MCLLVNSANAVRKIAEEDITVYKILEGPITWLKSPFFNFVWTLGKEYTTPIKKALIEQSFDILDDVYLNRMDTIFFGPGFHSSLSIGRIIRNIDMSGRDVYECTIPKGAEYIVGYTNLVISNKLIINKRARVESWKETI